MQSLYLRELKVIDLVIGLTSLKALTSNKSLAYFILID